MNNFSYNPMVSRLTPMVKNLLVANAVVFVVLLVVAPVSPYRAWWPSAVLGLSRAGLLHGMIWQPLTYMFVHGGFFHILANMLGLYFLGPEVERAVGGVRFLRFYLLSGIAAGLAWVILSGGAGWPCIGASGAVYAVVGAFAGLYPQRRLTMLLYFVIPINMTAITLLILVVGISIFMWLLGGGNVAHTAHLTGALCGYLYGNYLRSGRISLGARGGWTMADIRARLRRRNFRVLEPGEGPIDWRRVDAILDKARFNGIASLTRAEKELLDRASRERRG